MAKYVCKELSNTNVFTGRQDCVQWVEYQTSIDMLAITGQQRDVISTSMLLVIFGAWVWKQALVIIQGRRY